MNAFRRITIKQRTLVRNTCNNVVCRKLDLWGISIIGFGILGAGYGFYRSSYECEIYETDKFGKLGYITGMTIFMGVIGLMVGFTSPITLPIAIPAYAYLTYQERKKE